MTATTRQGSRKNISPMLCCPRNEKGLKKGKQGNRAAVAATLHLLCVLVFCVCVFVRACVCQLLCVCVCEREREYVCVCEQGFSLCVCSFIEIQGFVFLTCFYAKHSNKYYTILPTDMQIANHPYLLSIRHFATPTLSLSLSTETDKSRLGFFAIQSFATNIKA